MLGMFFVSGALFSVLLRWDQEEALPTLMGDPFTKYKLSFVYGISAVLLFRRYSKSLELICGAWHLWAFVALAATSVIWSISPSVTFLRSMALIGTTSFGLYLSLRFTTMRFLQVVALTFGFCAGLSMLFVVLVPEIGLMHGFYGGAWRGIFYHKNELGLVLVWTAIAFLFLALDQNPNRLVYAACFAATVAIAYFSQSVAYFLIILLLVPIAACVSLLRKTGILGAIVIFFFLGFFVISLPFIYYNLADIFHLLGRDPSITGRVGLWMMLITQFNDHPFFGFGYEAFWIGDSPQAASIREAIGWNVSHSHNAWIECILDTGVLGLAVLGMSFGVTILTVFRNLIDCAESEAQVHAVMILSLFLMTLTEAELLQQPSLQWVFYVFVATGAYRLRQRLNREGRSMIPMAPHGLRKAQGTRI